MAISEPTFGLDDFQRPKVLKDWDALATVILLILFGKPGFYPSIPNLGMNIQQYANTRIDEIDTDQLKLQLAYQCSLLKDDIVDGGISFDKVLIDNKMMFAIKIPIYREKKSNELIIGVQIDQEGSKYKYKLVATNNSII